MPQLSWFQAFRLNQLAVGAGVAFACIVDLDEARAVIAQQHHAVLATLRSDGTPQMSPVVVGLDEAGRLTISTRQTAYKLRNIRRDPRVWLCVLPDSFFGNWVQIEGVADIVELPDAMEPLVAYYRSLSGEHPDWDEYRAAMAEQQRVLVRVSPVRAGPDRSG
jgi:PPOX class probable F420-dependent enzyme